MNEQKDIVVAGRRGIAEAEEGSYKIAVAGEYGKALVGFRGAALVDRKGVAIAGREGIAIVAGSWGHAIAGDLGVAIANFFSTAQAGQKGEIHIRYFDIKTQRCRTKIGYIGENELKPNTPYRLNDQHEFEEVRDSSAQEER